VTEHRTKRDVALFLRTLVNDVYPQAEKIILVMDNLNTHTPAASLLGRLNAMLASCASTGVSLLRMLASNSSAFTPHLRIDRALASKPSRSALHHLLCEASFKATLYIAYFSSLLKKTIVEL
jgi:hypothetical protein